MTKLMKVCIRNNQRFLKMCLDVGITKQEHKVSHHIRESALQLKESGILLKIGIQVSLKKTGIHGVEPGLQDCLGSDFLIWGEKSADSVFEVMNEMFSFNSFRV